MHTLHARDVDVYRSRRRESERRRETVPSDEDVVAVGVPRNHLRSACELESLWETERQREKVSRATKAIRFASSLSSHFQAKSLLRRGILRS